MWFLIYAIPLIFKISIEVAYGKQMGIRFYSADYDWFAWLSQINFILVYRGYF